MREFPYITVGKILQELRDEKVKITRVTFYRLEERLKLPSTKKTSGKLPWRVYSREEANEVKQRIKEEYNIVSNTPIPEV
jgi:hypothetical protein